MVSNMYEILLKDVAFQVPINLIDDLNSSEPVNKCCTMIDTMICMYFSLLLYFKLI